MMEWRFGEMAEDGAAWMANPETLHAYVDYKTSEGGRGHGWRRVMVVTRAWLLAQVHHLEEAEGGRRVVLPALLVLPDGAPEQLQGYIADAVASGTLDRFSRTLEGV